MSEEKHIIHASKKRFTIISEEVIFNTDLTGNDFKIFAYLNFYGGQNGYAFTGLERMSNELNVSINTIRKSIKNLEKVGYLKVTKQRQKNGHELNHYYIYDPFYYVDQEKKTEKKLPPKDDSTTNKKDIYTDIISYLNEKANKSFKTNSKETIRQINGRLNEGYKLEDFKKVIDNKTSDWLNNDKMNEYLRPKTLFRPTNFENYINETQTKQVSNKSTKNLLNSLGGN